MSDEPEIGWWLTAKPGDKIVCVDDDWVPKRGAGEAPQKGQVCVLQDVLAWADGRHGFVVGLDGYKLKYCVSCFRPVAKKSTDAGMRILRSLLHTQSVPSLDEVAS